MSIKCFFGYHKYRVVGKCYRVEQLAIDAWIHKYAVMQCSGCNKVILKSLHSDIYISMSIVTTNDITACTRNLEQHEEQLKKDGWIPYEELVLTKGEYL